MRKYNNYIIIGVDAGYGNMKTARTIYPTGLVAMDTRPFFDGDILELDGTWYRIGEGHKAFNPDKTADEDFYILTLASIACELSVDQITEANVHLAVGLPTTWTGRQRESYRNYMLRSRDVRFVFNDVQYSIHLMDCSVFPQGYAAMVPMMDNDKKLNGFRNFMGTVMMADIGNGTMNIMRLTDGRPNDQHCWTEVLGVNQCVLTARKQMMDRYGIDMPEDVIEQFLRTGTANIRKEFVEHLTAIVRGYVTGLFDSLRSHGYDTRMMKLYVMGGGGCLVKHFGKYDLESVVFVDDLHAQNENLTGADTGLSVMVVEKQGYPGGSTICAICSSTHPIPSSSSTRMASASRTTVRATARTACATPSTSRKARRPMSSWMPTTLAWR